jgi:sugar phosphate isomerase/epimerase
MTSLTRSYKNRFPFRLGTTSFIYPALYSENVRKLGPYLDEIELLFFESRDRYAMPDSREIRELARLKDEFNLTYNIHLPTDVNIAAEDPAERNLAVRTYVRFIEALEELDPTTFTMHIPYEPGKPGGEPLWKTYSVKGMRSLLDQGVDSRMISVETLDYDPELLWTITEELDLSVCLDVGHMIVHGWDFRLAYETFSHRTAIIHLHGVLQGCDHVSLDRMDHENREKVRKMLQSFKGTVSLEVFAFEHLERSLDCLAEMF